jgi:hypothetical protein
MPVVPVQAIPGPKPHKAIPAPGDGHDTIMRQPFFSGIMLYFAFYLCLKVNDLSDIPASAEKQNIYIHQFCNAKQDRQEQSAFAGDGPQTNRLLPSARGIQLLPEILPTATKIGPTGLALSFGN